MTEFQTSEIARELESTTDALLQTISSFTREQLNAIPFSGSWTAGQVAEHLLKSTSGASATLRGAIGPTERRPDEHVETIKAIFLDFETKMASPEFILPSNDVHDKESLSSAFKSTAGEIAEVIQTRNLLETCTDFPFPELGELTRWEWIHFVICHSKRHTHQLRNIHERVAEEAHPVSHQT